MDPFKVMRLQFPVVKRLVYLNHAAVSPLPLCCRERIESYLEELTHFGALHYPERVTGPLEQARSLGARLLGTTADRVFIVRSTTQGLGIAATGIPFAEGDNVVLVDREFPANLRPWLPLRRRGVQVRIVPQRQGRVTLDDLDEAADRRTAAISVSFVQFLSGYRIRLSAVAEICRRNDALLVVDGIQGVGAFPLDVEAEGVDLLSADAHKWLLGPEGVGLGYVSQRALQRIEPALEGWLSVERPFDFFDVDQPLKESAARFEEGAYNTAGICGLTGSLELILSVGCKEMAERILELTDHLEDRLRACGWKVLSPRASEKEKSGILLVTRSGVDFEALNSRLRQEGIVASVRGEGLRLSPHGYNTQDELDRLIQILRTVAGPC